MNNNKLNKILKISLLSAVAFVLMYFELPLLILFPAWLKIDLGDLPALLASFALGPLSGVAVELIKNVLFFLFKNSGSFGIGETANFLVGSILVFTAGLFYNRNKSRKGAFIALTLGVIAMTVGATILNYFVFFPLFQAVLHFPLEGRLAIVAIAPFNLLKGIILSLLTLILYKKLSPILHK